MSISNPRQTFLNPTVPFAGTILGGLLPGEMMLLQGSIPKDADRFQIDLTCGSSVSPRADVAFHFNPRLGRSPCVVTNSLQGGKWGKEEIHYNTPFKQGQAYEILLLVLKDSFKVAVNGAHVLEYKQRVDLDRVDTVCISGKVNVEAVGILPSSAPDSPSVSLSSDSQMNPITSSSGDLSVPFSGELISGLAVGRSITIRAELLPHADKFGVDLCAGSDIALHLNPRLKKRAFVRNSELSGSWGPEEKKLAGAFPFSPGTYFEMIVLCDAQQFKVAVNGLHLFDYHHRVRDLKRITSISVYGDLNLLDVKIL